MAYKGVPESLLLKIQPDFLEVYATATGWSRVDGKQDSYSVYQHDLLPTDDLIIPLDRRYGDYARRMADAVVNIGQVGQRSSVEVLNDLLLPSDRFKVKLESPDTEQGSISLSEGVALLSGTKKTLYASAMDEIEPAKFHARMQSGKAEAFVEACRLGQTEIGSYITNVICPLDLTFAEDFSQIQLSLIDYKNAEFASKVTKGFPRKVTSRMMFALSNIVQKIAHGATDSLLEATSEDELISGNFFDGLSNMLPSGTDAKLSIIANWSPVVSPGPSVPRIVTFDHSTFSIIADIGSRMRPTDAPEVMDFLGKVTSISGQENAENLMQGEVIVSCYDDERIFKVKIRLSPKDFPVACDALKLGKYVRFIGTLMHDNKRVNWINNYEKFVVLPNITFGKQIKPKQAKKVKARLPPRP